MPGAAVGAEGIIVNKEFRGIEQAFLSHLNNEKEPVVQIFWVEMSK